MKQQCLIIRKSDFYAILKGEKKTINRNLRPSNFKKYLIFDEVGEEALRPVHFDSLKLISGELAPIRSYFIIEVNRDGIILVGNKFCQEVELVEDGIVYFSSAIEYTLGNILEKFNC